MPFREYAAYFKPEELATLTAVFDAAYQDLSVTHTNLTNEEKMALLKKKLMQRILVSATCGWRPRSGHIEGAGPAQPRWRFSATVTTRPMLPHEAA